MMLVLAVDIAVVDIVVVDIVVVDIAVVDMLVITVVDMLVITAFVNKHWNWLWKFHVQQYIIQLWSVRNSRFAFNLLHFKFSFHIAFLFLFFGCIQVHLRLMLW
jgi:hypothetical protein